jgi:hypothetical protein
MLQFHAETVECFSEFEEVLTVHFDNQAGHYLALQGWAKGFEEDAEGIGMIHVEVDDQINSGYDCFTSAELRRGSFRMTFDDQLERWARLGEVEVTFDLGPAEHEQLRDALGCLFRKFAAYRVVATGYDSW